MAGGVGTSTWVRLWRATHGAAYGFEITDAGHYTNKRVDVLVSSNTTASTSRIGPTLNTIYQLARHDGDGYYQPPPVLVIMHTVPGLVSTLKADLITVEPHVTAILRIWHKPDWLAMPQPPGASIPQHKDITAALAAMPAAIMSMYPGPVTSLPPAAPPAAARAPLALPGLQPQFSARQLAPGLTGGHPAIRAGPTYPSAPANGAHHNAMPSGGRHG